jgi:hypothetical protein
LPKDGIPFKINEQDPKGFSELTETERIDFFHTWTAGPADRLTVGAATAKIYVFVVASVDYEQAGKRFRVYGTTLNGGPARALHQGTEVPFKLVSFQDETLEVGTKVYWPRPIVEENTYKEETSYRLILPQADSKQFDKLKSLLWMEYPRVLEAGDEVF